MAKYTFDFFRVTNDLPLELAKLYSNVIHRAVVDIVSTSDSVENQRASAIAWVSEKGIYANEDKGFSFDFLCEALGFDSVALREQILSVSRDKTGYSMNIR